MPAGRTLIRRYVLALAPAGAGNEAAVTAASVPPLSGGPGSHGSAAAHALTIADSAGWVSAAIAGDLKADLEYKALDISRYLMGEFAGPERHRGPAFNSKVAGPKTSSPHKAWRTADWPNSAPRMMEPASSDHDHQAAIGQAVNAALASEGSPLDSRTRKAMEPRFGFDFGHVRIHADGRAASAANALSAYAFTLGRDIVFSAGNYRPADPWGRGLLMHELAHVVQQASLATTDAGMTVPAQEVASEFESSARDMAGGQATTLPRLGRPLVQRVGFFETIARFFGGGTFSVQELVAYLGALRRTQQIEGHYDSDNKARDIVRRSRAHEAEFSGLTESIRVLLIKEMLDGYVSGADENAILDLLTEAPPPEADRMIRAVGEPVLRQSFSGANLKRLNAVIEGAELSFAEGNWTAARVRAILRHEGREGILDQLAQSGWGVWSFKAAFDKWRYPDGHIEEEEVTQHLGGNSDRDAKLIRLNERLDDETAAFALIHESTHFLAGPATSQQTYLQGEVDARVKAEEYLIKRGQPESQPGYRNPDGTANVAAIHADVFQSPHYNPQERQRTGARRWVGDHPVPGMPPGSASAAGSAGQP